MNAKTIINWFRALYIKALSMFGKETLPTDYPIYCCGVSDALSLFDSKFVTFARSNDKKAEDVRVYYTDKESLKKMAPHLTTVMTEYRKFEHIKTQPDANGANGGIACTEVPDCDDIAIKGIAEAAFKFGITLFKVMGTIPKPGTTETARHAWVAALVSPTEYVFLELNLGFPWAGVLEVGEQGYEAKWWTIP